MSLRYLPGGRVEPPPPEPEWLTTIDGQRVRVPTWEECGVEPALDLANPLARQYLGAVVSRAIREHPTLIRDLVLQPRLLAALRHRQAALEAQR